jgi:hypothetical protein
MGAVFKKKLQQFYNKAIYKAKKLGDQRWRDVNKYYSGTGSCPREQPREDLNPDDAPEGGVFSSHVRQIVNCNGSCRRTLCKHPCNVWHLEPGFKSIISDQLSADRVYNA